MEQMRIKVNTAILAERANMAEQKIRTVKKRFDKIAGIVNNSVGYWEGDAGDAHRREYREYMEEIEQAVVRFQKNVMDLRKIAGIYSETSADTENISKDLPMDVIS